MKAVDPALAHARARAGDASSFLLGTSDPEEDVDVEADCAVRPPRNGVADLSQQTTRVNGQEASHNGTSQYSNGAGVNGKSRINGGLESGVKVVENGHGNSKVNGGLESDEEVVANGQDRRVQVNGNSKIKGGFEGKVVENGHDRRVQVNGSAKINGGLESAGEVVENGHDRRVQVNGTPKINGGLESAGKVVENGHDRRVQVNGSPKMDGGFGSAGKVVENGHGRLGQVNGSSKMNGGLEPAGQVLENGHDRLGQVNGSPKMNRGLESAGKVVENGHDRLGQVNGSPKMNGGLESAGKVVENGHDRLEQSSNMECGDKVSVNGESPTATWDRTVAEMKEHAFARLQDELKKAHQELKLRDEEVTRLSRIRQDVEAELEDLTASLFQEAHNMVREANVKQAAAERAHKESQMQVDVLVAEVSALKTLVLTSTPSRPNPHLHPQIDLRGNRTKDDSSLGATSIFNKKHRRSPSHFNLKYGRENSPPDSPVKEAQPLPVDPLNCKEGWEVDPDVHREFTAWKLNPQLDKSDPFISRIYKEEIDLCLDFPNKELSTHVRTAVESGNIFIEAVSDKTKTVFPKKCALLDVPRQCHYRMKFGDQEQWYCMSQICRNRIIAVCDFLNYLKYIERGLVKSSAHDVYWEITRLRKDMVLARLGLALLS